MKATTRTNIRKDFKAIGYKVSFKSNPFNQGLCNISFIPVQLESSTQKPIIVSKSNCYSKETHDKHKLAFDLANKYNGHWLEDTEQKII